MTRPGTAGRSISPSACCATRGWRCWRRCWRSWPAACCGSPASRTRRSRRSSSCHGAPDLARPRVRGHRAGGGRRRRAPVGRRGHRAGAGRRSWSSSTSTCGWCSPGPSSRSRWAWARWLRPRRKQLDRERHRRAARELGGRRNGALHPPRRPARAASLPPGPGEAVRRDRRGRRRGRRRLRRRVSAWTAGPPAPRRRSRAGCPSISVGCEGGAAPSAEALDRARGFCAELARRLDAEVGPEPLDRRDRVVLRGPLAGAAGVQREAPHQLRAQVLGLDHRVDHELGGQVQDVDLLLVLRAQLLDELPRARPRPRSPGPGCRRPR